MKTAQTQSDLVTVLSEGASGAIEVPTALSSVPPERMRFDGSALIDGATVNEWMIDPYGVKRLPSMHAGSEWPIIACSFDDVLVKDEGAWRLETVADRLSAAKSEAQTQIDRAAETERLKYITPGNGQMLTYQQKAEEAEAFVADPDPDPVDYPLLSVEVGITGATIADVAAVVVASFTQWQQIGSAIEAIRLGAKKAVSEAPDEAAVQAVLDGIAWPDPQVPA